MTLQTSLSVLKLLIYVAGVGFYAALIAGGPANVTELETIWIRENADTLFLVGGTGFSLLLFLYIAPHWALAPFLVIWDALNAAKRVARLKAVDKIQDQLLPGQDGFVVLQAQGLEAEQAHEFGLTGQPCFGAFRCGDQIVFVFLPDKEDLADFRLPFATEGPQILKGYLHRVRDQNSFSLADRRGGASWRIARKMVSHKIPFDEVERMENAWSALIDRARAQGGAEVLLLTGDPNSRHGLECLPYPKSAALQMLEQERKKRIQTIWTVIGSLAWLHILWGLFF